jgi:hypothetical protein
MKTTTTTKKIETKPTAKPKARKEKVVHRKPDGTIMLNPWTERTAWFSKAITEAKENKWTDVNIMKMAEKEFGKENIGFGPWTVAGQRARIKAKAA